MRRSEITELRLGLVRATISIKFVDTSQRKRAFPISLSLSLSLSLSFSLSPASNFDKGRKGNPKHKIMGRTYKPNQGQCLKCFYNLWQFFFFFCPL